VDWTEGAWVAGAWVAGAWVAGAGVAALPPQAASTNTVTSITLNNRFIFLLMSFFSYIMFGCKNLIVEKTWMVLGAEITSFI
jgi:hypothetical protein